MNFRQWICRRLGCFNIQTPSQITREEKLSQSTQRLDEVIGSLESNTTRLGHVVTDIHIQKNALEAFTKGVK